MGRREAVSIAQTQLRATNPRLSVDGLWGPRTDDTFVRSPVELQKIVVKTAIANGLRDEAQLRGRHLQPSAGNAMVQRFIAAARAKGVDGSSLVNLLANVEVESGFKPQMESHVYSPSRARSMIKALRGMTDSEIMRLVKAGPNAFFEAAYGLGTNVARQLGNTKPGDGARFPGRGLLQLTGRYNYEQYSAYSGIDVVNDPSKLLDPDVSIDSSIWFWKTNVMRVNADKDIIMASKAVNGDDNLLGRRKMAALKYATIV